MAAPGDDAIEFLAWYEADSNARRGRIDKGASALLAKDEPLALELPECATDGDSAYAKLLGKLVLGWELGLTLPIE